jgi:hypothetical protein
MFKKKMNTHCYNCGNNQHVENNDIINTILREGDKLIGSLHTMITSYDYTYYHKTFQLIYIEEYHAEWINLGNMLSNHQKVELRKFPKIDPRQTFGMMGHDLHMFNVRVNTLNSHVTYLNQLM